MTKTITLLPEECHCDLIAFYDTVATAIDYSVTENTYYDCRKIDITKEVQNEIWRYYSELGDSDAEIGTIFLLCGPKADVDSNPDPFKVIVHDGFVFEK